MGELARVCGREQGGEGGGREGRLRRAARPALPAVRVCVSLYTHLRALIPYIHARTNARTHTHARTHARTHLHTRLCALPPPYTHCTRVWTEFFCKRVWRGTSVRTPMCTPVDEDTRMCTQERRSGGGAALDAAGLAELAPPPAPHLPAQVNVVYCLLELNMLCLNRLT